MRDGDAQWRGEAPTAPTGAFHCRGPGRRPEGGS